MSVVGGELEIAIIGGGAAGLATAYLLDARHRVTLFEREAILGGNIRTLGRNVACPQLPAGVHLDAGVIEFSPEHFPRFHRLMDQLGVETRPVPVSTGLIRRTGAPLRALGKITGPGLRPRERLSALLELLRHAPEFIRFRRRARRAAADPEGLYRRDLDSLLERGPISEWMRLLIVYAYSIPRARVGETPAALAIPTLLRFTGPVSWTCVPGGVYRYVERLLARLRGRVITGARVRSVRRDARGVELTVEADHDARARLGVDAGGRRRFDRVVLATTPGQLTELLADPSDDERRRLAPWRDRELVTIVHDDLGMYARRGLRDYSEFDLFEETGGYNAHLGRLCALDPARAGYSLSFAMEPELDPARILHRQPHRTPRYSVAALATRRELLAHSGARHTFLAGAWLGDGLHEGAIESAARISATLGGRAL